MRVLAPALSGDGSVRDENLERDRPGHREDDRVDDRLVGRRGAHDDLDGRPSASVEERAAPAGGFTTGEWQGNTLVTYTTHIKAGAIRRNGAPSSDERR